MQSPLSKFVEKIDIASWAIALHERSIRRRRGMHPQNNDTARPTSLGRHRSPIQSMAASSNALLQPLTTTCTHVFTALIYHSTTVFWPPGQFCTPRTQTILIKLARNELLLARLTPLFRARKLRSLAGRTSTSQSKECNNITQYTTLNAPPYMPPQNNQTGPKFPLFTLCYYFRECRGVGKFSSGGWLSD